jgi:hypothetical protein
MSQAGPAIFFLVSTHLMSQFEMVSPRVSCRILPIVRTAGSVSTSFGGDENQNDQQSRDARIYAACRSSGPMLGPWC